jgi:hypothetical protein
MNMTSPRSADSHHDHLTNSSDIPLHYRPVDPYGPTLTDRRLFYEHTHFKTGRADVVAVGLLFLIVGVYLHLSHSTLINTRREERYEKR